MWLKQAVPDRTETFHKRTLDVVNFIFSKQLAILLTDRLTLLCQCRPVALIRAPGRQGSSKFGTTLKSMIYNSTSVNGYGSDIFVSSN